jgi:hypothetical protein
VSYEKRTINLVEVFDCELIGPSYVDHTFKLKFSGDTPGGKPLDVCLEFPAYFVAALARKLYAVVNKQQEYVDGNVRALKGDTE